MIELKPCPFCGCEGEQVSDGDDGYFIRCSSDHCDAGFGITMTARDWNTRPIEDKLQAEIDRLKSERLRWTKGGEGSHWEGCEDVHWDCRIAQLEAELARRDEDFAKYIVPRNCNVSDVSMTRDVSTDVKTPPSIENTNPDYYKDELYLDEDFRMLAKTYPADVSAIGVTALIDYVEALEAELARLQEKLHDEMGQLEIATDIGNKRWLALNDIYENGEKHNANWCKRKAQEGLGIK